MNFKELKEAEESLDKLFLSHRNKLSNNSKINWITVKSALKELYKKSETKQIDLNNERHIKLINGFDLDNCKWF
jgi:16S rRNA A1518/A1519 N6-dimethyltransferase RsmA/KsgA/DIM1 with predicted DNA glycosylase/AP lyase activity